LQIENLKTFSYEQAEIKVEIAFDLHMTFTDDKVFNILTGTILTQSCPICGASPQDFFNISDINSKAYKPKHNYFAVRGLFLYTLGFGYKNSF